VPKIRGIFTLALLAAGVVLLHLHAGGEPTPFSSAQRRGASLPDAVWLYDTWHVEVSPTHGILLDISRKARVNGPQGRVVGRLKIWETFYQSLTDFSATITDTLGGVLYSVKKENLEYGFPFSDYRLYSNDRLYTAELTGSSFPYLVEYHYRLQIDNTFFWPDWVFPDAFPRQEASYTVEVPHLFRYRTRPVLQRLEVSSERTLKRDVTRWSVENVGGDPDHPGSAPAPVLFIAPESFIVAHQRGSAQSWETLGRWYDELTRGRRTLSRRQVDEVRSWVSGESDPRRIVSRLKDMVSRNWRYVAIEVGIGGWRPHEAASVFDSRYGDCKDLTFLWLGMLDVFNILAYPALVRARNPQPLEPDFPKDWFDHVIGCAIVGADTIWADLTAPGYPEGRLPFPVEDRWALVIGRDGGQLCRTPASSAEENRLVRSLVGRLGEDGRLSFVLHADVRGHKLGIFGGGGAADNHARRAAEILGVLPGRLQIDTAGFLFSAESLAATIDAAGTIAEWAETTDKRLIFPLEFAGWAAPQPLNNPGSEEPHEQRPYPCQEIDSLVIVLPHGFAPESVPRSVEAGGKDGSITITTHVTGDTLKFFRDFEALANRADRAVGPQTGHMREVLNALQRANAVFVRQNTPPTPAESAPDRPNQK